jgi:hypothetical protein
MPLQDLPLIIIKLVKNLREVYKITKAKCHSWLLLALIFVCLKSNEPRLLCCQAVFLKEEAFFRHVSLLRSTSQKVSVQNLSFWRQFQQ